jgi:hypothetical protein
VGHRRNCTVKRWKCFDRRYCTAQRRGKGFGKIYGSRCCTREIPETAYNSHETRLGSSRTVNDMMDMCVFTKLKRP